MITYKINDKPYKIPTKWEDITFAKYAEVKDPYLSEQSLLEKLSAYSGISQALIDTFTIGQALDLFRHLAFLESDIIEYKQVEPEWIYEKLNALGEKEKVTVSDISKDSWYKLERAKQIFTENENPYLAIAGVIKEYLNLDIMEKPVTEVYGYVSFFLHSLTDSLKSTNV